MANKKIRKATRELRWERTDKDGKKTFSNAIDSTVFPGGILGKNEIVGNHEIPDKVFQRELKEYHEDLIRNAAAEAAVQQSK